jgi:hypothetical protein
MLLTEYDDDLGVGLLSEGDPDDMTAHLDYLRKLNQELIDNGELVEVQGLAGQRPSAHKRIAMLAWRTPTPPCRGPILKDRQD